MKGKTSMTGGHIAQNNKNGEKTVSHISTVGVGGKPNGKMTATGSRAKGKLKHFSKIAIGTAAKAGKVHGGVS